MVEVRVDGSVMHLHADVAKQSEYFTACLAWRPENVVDLELPAPCSLQDFLPLVHHMYTQAPFEISNLDTALRLAVLAGMLLLPKRTVSGIAEEIRRLLKTDDDEVALEVFLEQHQLPADLAATCLPDRGERMSLDKFEAMIQSAAHGCGRAEGSCFGPD